MIKDFLLVVCSNHGCVRLLHLFRYVITCLADVTASHLEQSLISATTIKMIANVWSYSLLSALCTILHL